MVTSTDAEPMNTEGQLYRLPSGLSNRYRNYNYSMMWGGIGWDKKPRVTENVWNVCNNKTVTMYSGYIRAQLFGGEE